MEERRIRRVFPEEKEVAGIFTAIVDPHNHGLLAINRLHKPVIVLSIDDHDDLGKYTLSYEAAQEEFGEEKIYDMESYIINGLDETNYKTAGMHYKIIGADYYFNPGLNIFQAHGRCRNLDLITPETYLDNQGMIHISKDKAHFFSMNTATFKEDIQTSKYDFAINIDLDAFIRNNENLKNDEIVKILMEERFARSRKILEEARKPDLILIARSQTPKRYTPEQSVDYLENRTLGMFEDIYRKK